MLRSDDRHPPAWGYELVPFNMIPDPLSSPYTDSVRMAKSTLGALPNDLGLLQNFDAYAAQLRFSLMNLKNILMKYNEKWIESNLMVDQPKGIDADAFSGLLGLGIHAYDCLLQDAINLFDQRNASIENIAKFINIVDSTTNLIKNPNQQTKDALEKNLGKVSGQRSIPMTALGVLVTLAGCVALLQFAHQAALFIPFVMHAGLSVGILLTLSVGVGMFAFGVGAFAVIKYGVGMVDKYSKPSGTSDSLRQLHKTPCPNEDTIKFFASKRKSNIKVQAGEKKGDERLYPPVSPTTTR